MGQAKEGAPAYCTNFFPAPSKLQRWIDHGELYCDGGEGHGVVLPEGSGLLASVFLRCRPFPAPTGARTVRDAADRRDRGRPRRIEPAVAGLAGSSRGPGSGATAGCSGWHGSLQAPALSPRRPTRG